MNLCKKEICTVNVHVLKHSFNDFSLLIMQYFIKNEFSLSPTI